MIGNTPREWPADMHHLRGAVVTAPLKRRASTTDLSTYRWRIDDGVAQVHFQRLLPVAPGGPFLPVLDDVYAGRPTNDDQRTKGNRAAREVEQILSADFPGEAIVARPSYPLGWSATVPLKVSVGEASSQRCFFAKYCDPHDGILTQVGKEAAWGRALSGTGVAPEVRLWDRERRLLLTDVAPGRNPRPRELAQPRVLGEAAKAARILHGLPVQAVPFEPNQFIRPYAEAASELRAAKLVDKGTACRGLQYDRLLRQTLARFGVHCTPIHNDLGIGNMLLNEASTPSTLQLVDFGVSRHADPMHDLGFLAINAFLPMARLPELLGYYQGAAIVDDQALLSRLQLNVAIARHERLLRSQAWHATDFATQALWRQLVQDDLRVVAPLLRAALTEDIRAL